MEINQKHIKIKRDIIRSLKDETWLKEEECLRDMEYMECVHDILSHTTFQRMNDFIQHGKTTTLTHCIHVSYYSYKVCKRYGWDYRSAARAALLHDLFLYDWHTHRKETGNCFHGFTHPKVALMNAKKSFHLNHTEQDIIIKHMWPLTVIPPKTKEGYVVMYADKMCGLEEVAIRFGEWKKKQKNVKITVGKC